ncbi:MAG: hypothetical protein NTY07_18030 [Bacteroidia bacterium]|nr:hypothetical protein [Bacteroidia bacterium]
MIFEPNYIYHIYNQGNNRQKVFFNRENYLFFLKKVSEHILPYADVLAWCLMPNHFHLMVYVRSPDSEGFTPSETLTYTPPSAALTNTSYKNLNDSIGVLLRSYARAINKERNRTGSLFRRKTKADCITKIEGILEVKPSLGVKASLLTQISEKEYLQICFDYIHQNPEKAGLVDNPEKWEFSSYLDYCGMRKGKLISRERAEEFGLTVKPSIGAKASLQAKIRYLP